MTLFNKPVFTLSFVLLRFAGPFCLFYPARYFDENGKVCRTNGFDSGCKHHLSDKQGSFELFGDRVVTLGTNMYENFKHL